MDSISKGGPSAGGTTNMMHIFQSCNDISDAVELFGPQQLYLKPVARLNISVQLPQLKQPGKTISNWEVMERLKNMVKPNEFIVLKVTKSTLDFIRFEGEIESKSNLEGVVSRLDGRTIKLSGFSDLLKVRAAEAKISFPTRHSWDSYFRDAKNMNEMKPGERPDTIHITNLPCKWFSSKHDLAHRSDLPSEYIFRKVFEQFGEVRCVDIPLLDPYRNLMKAQISGMKTFSFGQGLAFEGYVQFQEYVCFVKAMDALRGMKLLHKEGDKAFTASIKVDFDKTKHLSEVSIRRRKQEREHLMANEREVEEGERRAKEAQEREAEALRNKEREKQQIKEDRRRQREERRKAKHLKRIKEEETRVMNKKIAIEERKLIIAQRKLESIRLLDELFERVKMKVLKEKSSPPKSLDTTKEDGKASEKQGTSSKEDLSLKERELRQRLLKKYKSIQEKLLEEQREKLRRTVEGKTRLQSVATKPSDKDGSDSDSSSNRKSPSRRSDKSKKRNDDRRSNSADRRVDWYPDIPMSSLSPLDFTAYVQAYGFQPRFHDRFSYREGFYRQRGRDYGSRWQRYPRGRNVQPFYYGQWNEEYYKYFRTVAKKSRSRSISRSRSRSLSRSNSRRRSGSRSRKRSKSRSRSRSKSSSRQRSRSKSRQKSRPKTKSRSRSWSKSRSRSKSKSRSKSRSNRKSRSKSKSPRSRSKFDRSRSSPERFRSKTRHRSKSCSRKRSRSRSRSGSRETRRRSSSIARSSPGKHVRSKSNSRSQRRKSDSSRDHRASKSNRCRSPSPRKRSSRRSTSPNKRSRSRSKSRNKSKERAYSKKSLRSLSRELSLSLSPELKKRPSKEKSGKKPSANNKEKKLKKSKDSKNGHDKQKAK